MNYAQLSAAIQDYTQNYETDFISNIPVFVEQAEERIYNNVQLPALRRNQTGNTTANNKYITLPVDYLSTYSFSVINPITEAQTFLLNKDVNFIRQAYPDPNYIGAPRYYAQFDANTFILGPTPDLSYGVELHYYYYPESIVQGVAVTVGTITAGTGYVNGTYFNVPLTGGSGSNALATITVSGGSVTAVTITKGGSLYTVGNTLAASAANLGGAGSGFSVPLAGVANVNGTSWLGDNFDTVLLYGSLVEAYTFMKGEQDLVTLYNQKYVEALALLKRLGDGLDRQDAYRSGQVRVKVT